MNVLIACEYSAIVRTAFEERGHNAWSCDILPTEKPGNHFQAPIQKVLELGLPWDLMIAHPTCTFLTNSGVQHLKEKSKAKIRGAARVVAMKEAAAFFNLLKNAKIPRISLENPIPHNYARELIGDYTQLIQPYEFGDGEQKAICLWLKNLPCLRITHKNGDMFCQPEPGPRVQRVHRMVGPGPNRAKERSRFFKGVAAAMADQWGCL